MPQPAISFVSVMNHRQGAAAIERPEVYRFVISEFARNAGYEISEALVEELTGQESDALNERPILRRAIDTARQRQCPIIVASLSRLARDTRMLSELMALDVTFIVSGLGVVTEPFVLLPYRHLPRRESEGAGRSGIEWPRAGMHESGEPGQYAREVLGPRNRRAANERARQLAHVVEPKLAAGKSLRRIAEELNEEGVPTARGGRWHLATVQRLVARLNA